MAVLIEAISVVIRADVLQERYPGGWDAFARAAPKQTLCADGELVRIGFMSPSDVEIYVTSLREHDILYQEQGKARDLVVVDQMRGPLVACDWIEFGRLNLDNDPAKPVAACRKTGSLSKQVVTPEAWTFELVSFLFRRFRAVRAAAQEPQVPEGRGRARCLSE